MKRSALLFAGIGTCFVVIAPWAFAQSNPDAPTPPAVTAPADAGGPAPLAQSLTGLAKEAYTTAQALMQNGDFRGAYAKLSQAYDLEKDPRLLFDMAIAARAFHDYALMQSLLLRYERDGGALLSAEDVVAVDNALAMIRLLVGAVKVSVDQEGAVISLDGASVGTAPLTGPLAVNMGTHRISVDKDGFEPAEKVVDVAGAGEAVLAFTLVRRRQEGRLTVAADPQATVIVDGHEIAGGRFDGRLAAGAHQVRVMQPGKMSYRAEVDLRDGETRTLDVSLESEKRFTGWPWVVGGVLVTAGAAAVTAAILYRPPERTMGVPPGAAGGVTLMSVR
jgi:hypothetical protein